jgi:hypothetical protein
MLDSCLVEDEDGGRWQMCGHSVEVISMMGGRYGETRLL